MSSNNNSHCFHSTPLDSPSNNNKGILSEYNIIKLIGRGSFSIVKLGENKITKEKVAIKIMQKNQSISQDSLIRIEREIKMLKSLNHENVIKIYNIFEDSKRFYIIMEFCENGELFNRIVEKKHLSEDESAIFYYQLINGLEHIHKHNIIHRDLKPENLLLSKDDILKIIDFGLSNYSRYDILLDTPCGSPNYASPEMVTGQKYNGFLADIWSTGIILFAMICGYLPFEDSNNETLFKKIYYCKINYPKNIGKLPLDLLQKIIVSDPCTRITLEQIKQHPFYLKGKLLFNRKNRIKSNNNKKMLFKCITPSIKYKIMKNIFKIGYKLQGEANNHIKNKDNDLLDYKPSNSESKNKIFNKVYKLNETENYRNNKNIDNEEEVNGKGNSLKVNFNNYKIYKINQCKNKPNYKTPTDSIPKNKKVSKEFDCSNNEIKETEIKSKKSIEKIKKIKKIKKPCKIEIIYNKKADNIRKLYFSNGPNTVRNKARIQKNFFTENNNTLMPKNYDSINLENEQMYNNPNKINFIYNKRVKKVLNNQKCVSAPKNRDKLNYSLTNKYPHNNYKKKYFLKINKTDRNIYDSNTYNDKYFKENDSINLTSINQNGKKKNKLNQYFNKKFINSSFNKQIRNNQYITDHFDLFNLSREKKDITFIQNNNNIEKNSKINSYLDKVSKILKNKYNDSEKNFKSLKHKRKINIIKIARKEPLIRNINTEKSEGNIYINDNSINRINYNKLNYNGNIFINNESKNINKYNNKFRSSENTNSKISINESSLYNQREKTNLEDEKNNNEYSKYKQNIKIRLKNNKNIPIKKHQANVINIKNIKQNMKSFKNSNYIIYNNTINENNKSRKKIFDLNKNIKSNIRNEYIHANDINNKLSETIKVKNSYQIYNLDNSTYTNNYSLNTNAVYFDQSRNKEESFNTTTFKNENKNQNFIKKIILVNNKTLNILKNNNNFENRTLDIMNNDSFKRQNLTSNLTTKSQRIINEKFTNLKNGNYLYKEKSNLFFDKLNNKNELQKTYCETENYNSIINSGNDTYTFPYTSYIKNIYPIENYKISNTIETDRMHFSTIGQKYSNILNE